MMKLLLFSLLLDYKNQYQKAGAAFLSLANSFPDSDLRPGMTRPALLPLICYSLSIGFRTFFFFDIDFFVFLPSKQELKN